MNLLLTVFLVLSVVVQVIGVAHDEACDTSSDCTDANTYCQPVLSPTCTMGKCRCLEYMAWDENDSKCKVKKYEVDRCNTTLTSCQGGALCSGAQGQCECSGDTNRYYRGLEKCVSSTSTLKLIGEDCSITSNCYEDIPGSVECLIPTGSSGSQKKCQCASGYIHARGSCRKPHHGEACTTDVDCTMQIQVTDDSIVSETCSGTTNLCECPQDTTKVDFEDNGIRSHLCMNDFDGELLDVGVECTMSNQCSSKICSECPGDSGKKCLAAPAS